MKKVFVLFSALFLFVLASNAQVASTNNNVETTAHNHHGKKGGKGFMKQLNLSTDQQTNLKSLSKEEKGKRDAIKSNTSLNDQQKKQQMKDLKKTYATKRNAVFTDDQKAQIAKMRSQRSKKHNAKSGDTTTGDNSQNG